MVKKEAIQTGLHFLGNSRVANDQIGGRYITASRIANVFFMVLSFAITNTGGRDGTEVALEVVVWPGDPPPKGLAKVF